MQFQNLDQIDSEEFSRGIDRELGFQIEEIEKKLIEQKRFRDFQSRSWIGLDAQVLNTPYDEIFDIFSKLQGHNIKKVIDFGAAYGRVGIVLNSFFPNADFIGYEIVKERADEANRIYAEKGLKKARVVEDDILKNLNFSSADLYFVYDFSNPSDLKVILNWLSDRMFKDNFAFVARGRGISSLIENKYPVFNINEDAYFAKNWTLYFSRKEE